MAEQSKGGWFVHRKIDDASQANPLGILKKYSFAGHLSGRQD